jgi:pilus assembly protein CpaC
MSNTTFITRKDKAMKSGLLTASLVGLSLFLAPLVPVPAPALAADNDSAVYDDADQNRFVRLGVNKSAVVRLPAEARDVIIGNPGIVDAVIRTKTTAYLFAREVGQTNIFFFDGQGQQILALDLEVAMDSTLFSVALRATRVKSKPQLISRQNSWAVAPTMLSTP